MLATIREFADNAADPKVRGYLHLPATPNHDGLVLTHGAGSNAQAPLLIALAETFSAAGFTVLRCDLPYRQARSFGPPGPGDAARDRAGLRNALAAMQKMISGRLFLGGHSYGGRQSSMLCASERDQTWSRVSCCSPTRCIPRANRSSSAPNISPTCIRPRSLSVARAIPSVPLMS